MKKTITIILGIVVLMATFNACKKDKDDLSQYALKTDVKNTVIENINLTIMPSDWTWNSLYNSWEYSQSHSYTYNNALVGYVINGEGNQLLPYYNAQSGVTIGLVDYTYGSPPKIIVTYYNGTTSLQRPSGNTYVYLKIIPSALVVAHPNVNYQNYAEVKAAFNLKD